MTFHDTALGKGGSVQLVTGPFGAADRVITLDRPMAIAEIIAEHGLAFRLPTIAVMNGEPVLRGSWALRVVRPGEVLSFVAVPRGGGDGGGQGKQLIGIIAALALSIAAPMIGGALFGAGTLGASLASAAILTGGSLLLNALFPPPQETPAAIAETIYSVSAASNQATPLEVLPVLYGRLRFAPRHATRPYSEYRGNDQYLYQLFLVTAGKAGISKIEIGETEAWSEVDGYSSSFSDLQFEIIHPGQSVTLFPANVVTSTEVAGQSVPDPAAVLGPFVVNAAGTTIDRIAVDFAFPGGLWTADGRGVASNSIALRAQYQAINAAGAPIGGWVNLFAETIQAATRTPQRMSRDSAVAPGRYQVRFLADEAFDPDDGNAVNRVVWAGLRGYLTDFVTPPNCTMLAMKVRASELSQAAANQVRVTGERYLPVWNGAAWVEQKTRSIAWATADLLMNADYSIGLTPAGFDLAQLKVLDTTWADRGDTFNAIFDRDWTLQDALRAVLRAGRTQMVRMGGRIGFVRLEPKLIKRTVFSNRNVVRGSFRQELVMFDEDKPDHVVGTYLDETTWSAQEVVGGLASVGAEAPQKLEWFGITDHDQAWRETVTEAAVNAFQREFVGFTAEWEGKLLVRGEPILVQHPFIEGIETVALNGRAGDVLTLDRVPAIDLDGDDLYVIIRGKDGREWGPCLADGMVGKVITLNAVDRAAVSTEMGSLTAIMPKARAEKAHVILCKGEMRPFNGLVVSAVPNGNGRVDILAVIDAPEVYLADATEVMPSPWAPPTLPPVNPAAPLLQGLYAKLALGIAQLEVDAMWQPSPGAISGYVAEVSYDPDTVPDEQKTWTPIYAGMQNRFTEPVLPQPFTLRVAAEGVLRGPWARRVFALAEVPDITIPPTYLDLDGIKSEVMESVVEVDRETRIDVRDLIEGKREQILLAAAGQLADYSDRQLLRTSLVAQTNENRAEFKEDILVATGPTSALASRIAELRAEVFNPDTGLPATASALNLLSAEVHDPGTGLEALANMVDLLAVSYGDMSADGLLSVQVGVAPAGVSSRAILSTRASAGGAVASAAMMLDSRVIGGVLTSEILMVGGRISLVASTSPTATKRGLLVVDGDNVYIDNARIRNLTAAQIDVAQLVASSAFVSNLRVGSANIDALAVGTLQIANGAIAGYYNGATGNSAMWTSEAFVAGAYPVTLGVDAATNVNNNVSEGDAYVGLFLDNLSTGVSTAFSFGGTGNGINALFPKWLTKGQTYRLRLQAFQSGNASASIVGTPAFLITVPRK